MYLGGPLNSSVTGPAGWREGCGDVTDLAIFEKAVLTKYGVWS